MTIREAKPADIADIMLVMEAAKGIMRASGNMHQWADGYPSEDAITADMEKKGGFVIEDANKVVGYFAFLASPEPTYAQIYEGQWVDDVQSYHVVHRIASYPDVHGIFSAKIMQHNLLKHNFTYCGIIYLLSGDERLAYQRIIK